MKTLARPRDKAAVLVRLGNVGPESARRWGRMSAHQVVCHLGDGFRMALGEKPSRPVAGRMSPVMRWIALYLPLPWPAGIETTPEIDQEKEGTCPTDFGADVARLEALVEELTLRSELDGREHPVFGRMSRAAWLRWGYLHMDHHLRQFGA